MTGFRHILFPVDFSERSCSTSLCHRAREEVRCKNHLAAQSRRASRLLRRGRRELSDRGRLGRDERRYHRAAQKFLGPERLRAESLRVAAVGDPAAEIVDYTLAHGVDLIMMPTHGYGPFRSMLLGSVTAKVLHDCDVPSGLPRIPRLPRCRSTPNAERDVRHRYCTGSRAVDRARGRTGRFAACQTQAGSRRAAGGLYADDPP